MLGETTSAKQFVEKIKQEIPDVQLVVDTTAVLGQAQDLQRAGADPNPYEGMITAEGETGAEHSQGEEAERCREIYTKATGKEVPGPERDRGRAQRQVASTSTARSATRAWK